MRKKLSLFAVLIAVTLMSCIGMTSCGKNHKHEYVLTQEDIQYVLQVVDSIDNPCVNSVQEFDTYVYDLRKFKLSRHVLNTVDIQILNNVYNVVKNKTGKVTPLTVAEEYLTHQDVYNYIKPSESVIDTSPTQSLITDTIISAQVTIENNTEELI